MIVYLVRHGADDNSKRGGWSNNPLSDEGKQQSQELAQRLANSNCDAEIIYSSDLLRAKQTADVLAQYLDLKVEYTKDFREVNNGDLAGMDNDVAIKLYPDYFWRKLKWEQCYPNGESPKEFFIRIKNSWKKLMNYNYKSVILVTHGGVINVIMHLVKGVEYSNKSRDFNLLTANYIIINTDDINRLYENN